MSSYPPTSVILQVALLHSADTRPLAASRLGFVKRSGASACNAVGCRRTEVTPLRLSFHESVSSFGAMCLRGVLSFPSGQWHAILLLSIQQAWIGNGHMVHALGVGRAPDASDILTASINCERQWNCS